MIRLRPSYLIAAGLAVGATLWVLSGMIDRDNQAAGGETAAETAAAEQPRALPLVQVRTATARLRDTEIVLFGRTEAVNSAEIAAETAARVIARPVVKGAPVKKGTVILRLAMDDRRARLKEAEAKVEYQEIAYNAAMRLSKKQFQSRVRLAEEKAGLQAAKAELERIRLDIARTSVRAPIDGVVDELPANVGDYVRVGDVVAKMVNLDPIRVVGQVSERNVTRIRMGAQAAVVLPDGRTFVGTVRYVSRTASETTRTFRVDVWADNAEGSIPEGLTAEMRLPAESQMAHVETPAILTLDDAGVIGVKAVDEAGRVVFHPVRILADTADGVWLGDLPETLTLITVGQEFVRPGERVRTMAEETASSGGGES